MEKEVSASWFYFTRYTLVLCILIISKDSGCHKSRDICDRNVYWRERKGTNKGSDKQEEADYLLHNIISNT